MSRASRSAPPEARRFYDEVYAPGSQPAAAYYEGRERWERDAVDPFLEAADASNGILLEVGVPLIDMDEAGMR